MQTKVSVIIPVYNAENYIRKCLNSVLNQTLHDIEIICIDDGSTDSSLKIIQEYSARDSRIKILKQKNLYAGVARNKGLAAAHGEYVFFADADDYCDLRLLEETYNFAIERKVEMVVFDYFKINNTECSYYSGLNIKKIANINESFSYQKNTLDICNTINPTPWNKLINRSFLIENNILYAELSTTNDITFATICALKAKSIGYLNKGLYYYRVGVANNITSRKRDNLENIIKAVLQVYDEAKNLSYFESIKASLVEFVAQNLFVGLDRYAGDTSSFKYIEYKHKVESIFASHPLFVGSRSRNFIGIKTMKRIMKFKKSAIERGDFRYALDIIISLTSYPKRIGTVHKVIASLWNQTLRPTKIILWLSKEQFVNLEQDLPFYLLEYVENGLEIRWCAGDMKSHKKYFYAIQEYPEALHITVDDDLVYDKNMIKKLFLSYLEYPEAVSAMRVHLMKEKNGEIMPYSCWEKEYGKLMHRPSMKLFSTSGAGTLYPPHAMSKWLFSSDMIKRLCFNADDVWLKFMQVINKTPVVLVNTNQRLKCIDGTQEETLYSTNVFLNDEQIKNTIAYLDAEGIISKEEVIERVFFAEDNENIHEEVFECGEDCLKEENKKLKDELVIVKKNYSNIKNGLSFRIGRIITYIPRMVFGKK